MREHKHTWTPRPATQQYVCVCGAVRPGVLTFAMMAQAERIDVYNRAQRTYKSRRKFILTGEA
jgi:hypothetical protein